MPIRAAVAGKAGVHEPQAVQKLRPGAEGAADARHAGALMERQRGGDIQRLVHTGLGSLGHAAAGVGGQGLQITPGTLGVQHPQRQGRLARAGHPCDAHDLTQRDIDIYIFQIVDLRATDQHFIDHNSLPRQCSSGCSAFLGRTILPAPRKLQELLI